VPPEREVGGRLVREPAVGERPEGGDVRAVEQDPER